MKEVPSDTIILYTSQHTRCTEKPILSYELGCTSKEQTWGLNNQSIAKLQQVSEPHNYINVLPTTSHEDLVLLMTPNTFLWSNMYLHTYTHAHTHTHTCTHTYMHTHMPAHIHTYMYIKICIIIARWCAHTPGTDYTTVQTILCAFLHACKGTFLNVCACVCVCVCVCVNTWVLD